MEKNLYNPKGRALANAISIIVSSILCSSLVTDITLNGKVEWSLLFQSLLFYITLIFGIFLVIYYTGMYKADINIVNEFEEYEAFHKHFLDKSMEQVIATVTKKVADGDLDEFYKLSDFLERKRRKK